VGDFEASTDDMHAAAEAIRRISDDFGNDLAGLRKTVRSVIGSSWQGRAAGSHDSAWAEFFDSANDIVTGLADDAAALHRAAAEYVARDRSTSDKLKRLRADPSHRSLNLPW
jgi:WXG100 family type VII secretion target